MSKYSDKVKRREEMARRQIEKPQPPPSPMPITPSDPMESVARCRNMNIVGDIYTALDLAMGLVVRAASLADNWAKCNRRKERFYATQAKATCRAAITRLATAYSIIAKSDFASLDATNKPTARSPQNDEPKATEA